MTTYYVDTSSAGGNGTTIELSGANAAFATLAAVAAKSGGYSAGDTICLKRGCTWYETIALPSSGSSGGGNITLTNYGTGALPIISGEKANPSTYSWAVHDTHIFKLNVGATNPYVLWRTTAAGHTFKMQENTTSIASLMDLEWYYDGTYVYVRDDSGTSTPTDTIRIPQRNGITASNKTFITVDGVAVLFLLTAGIQATTSSEGWIIKNSEIGWSCGYCVNFAVVKNTYIQRNFIHNQEWMSTNFLNIVQGANAADALHIENNLFLDINCGASIGSGTAPGAEYFYNNTCRNFRGNYYANTTKSAFAVIDVRGNIFASSGWGTGTNINYVEAGPTHTFDYNLCVANGATTSLFLDPDLTLGAHCITDNARFKNSLRYGIVSFVEDNVMDAINELSPLAAAYNINVTCALSGTEWYNLGAGQKSSLTTLIQDFVNNKGHELGNHTLHHCRWSLMDGIAIQYVGAGAAASLSISGNTLTTTVDGGTDLTIDLTNASYDTMTKVAAYIDGLANYVCSVKTAGTSTTANIISTVLKDATYADIKTASVDIAMDTTRYVQAEAVGWNNTIAGLFGITPTTLTYPDTSPNSNADVVAKLAASGVFEGARLASSGPYLMSSGIDLFALDCSTSFWAEQSRYMFEQNLNDTSPNGLSQTLTGVNTAYSASGNSAYGSYSLDLVRANSAYAHRATGTSWDKSGRDWLLTMFIKPKDFTAKQTIFSQCNDANNYCELYLDTSGYVHFDVMASGSYTLQMTSSQAITTSYFYRITLYQAFNRWKMYLTRRVDEYTFDAPVRVVETTNTTTIPAYTGEIYIGCFYDGSTQSNFCNCYLDAFANEKGGWLRSMSAFSLIADAGLYKTTICHAETGMARAMYIRVFDALQEFNGATNSITSGKVRAMSQHQAIVHLKSNGRQATDPRGGTSLYRMDIPYSTNYDELAPDSPAIYAGVDLSITGGDRVQMPIRNPGYPTIGCREQYPKIF